MSKKYYSLVKQDGGNEADIYIFGDIVDPTTKALWGIDADTSAFSFIQDLNSLGDVGTIRVHINSYGGHVSEGLAIYNALKNHKAKVITYCDGFACSIASVVFMAGSERIMYDASLLMIHNAWTFAAGNAEELRKQADDLDTITKASINAYLTGVSISEEELIALMDAETWLSAADACKMGFATSAEKVATEEDKAAASVRSVVFGALAKVLMEESDEDDDKEDDDSSEEPDDDSGDGDSDNDTDDGEDDAGDNEDPDSDEEDEDQDDDDEDSEKTDAKSKQWLNSFFNALKK